MCGYLTKFPNRSAHHFMCLWPQWWNFDARSKNFGQKWTWVWCCFSNCKPWLTLKHITSGKRPNQVLAQDEADKTLERKVWILGLLTASLLAEKCASKWASSKKNWTRNRSLSPSMFCSQLCASQHQPLLSHPHWARWYTWEVFTAGKTTSQMTSLALCWQRASLKSAHERGSRGATCWFMPFH